MISLSRTTMLRCRRVGEQLPDESSGDREDCPAHKLDMDEEAIEESGRRRETEQDELFIHSGAVESHATTRLREPLPERAHSMLSRTQQGQPGDAFDSNSSVSTPHIDICTTIPQFKKTRSTSWPPRHRGPASSRRPASPGTGRSCVYHPRP